MAIIATNDISKIIQPGKQLLAPGDGTGMPIIVYDAIAVSYTSTAKENGKGGTIYTYTWTPLSSYLSVMKADIENAAKSGGDIDLSNYYSNLSKTSQSTKTINDTNTSFTVVSGISASGNDITVTTQKISVKTLTDLITTVSQLQTDVTNLTTKVNELHPATKTNNVITFSGLPNSVQGDGAIEFGTTATNQSSNSIRLDVDTTSSSSVVAYFEGGTRSINITSGTTTKLCYYGFSGCSARIIISASQAETSIYTSSTASKSIDWLAPEVQIPDPTSVSLTPTTYTLSQTDNTVTLKASVYPTDATQSVHWATSRSSVATVNNGKVTAVKPGTATITASTDNGKSASCNITVKATSNLISGSGVDSTINTSYYRGSITLVPTVTSNGAIAATIVSQNNVNASFSTSSSVRSGEPITLSYTATSTSSSGSIYVKLTSDATGWYTRATDKNITITTPPQPQENINVQTISISGGTSINVGETTRLTATISPNNATNKTLTWNSNNDNVATVDATGLVTGTGAGTAEIRAYATDGSNQHGIHQITVTQLPTYYYYVGPTASIPTSLSGFSTTTTKPSTVTFSQSGVSIVIYPEAWGTINKLEHPDSHYEYGSPISASSINDYVSDANSCFKGLSLGAANVGALLGKNAIIKWA